MKRQFRRPSPALVVAIFALVVATSGTAIAVASQNGDTLITKRTLSGNRLRINTVTSAEISNLAWGAIILQNGWADGRRAPTAAVDVQGIVHLRGVVRGGTEATIGMLPDSALPRSRVYLSAHNNAGDTVGIILQSSGSIAVQGALGPDMFVSLDGLTYAR